MKKLTAAIIAIAIAAAAYGQKGKTFKLELDQQQVEAVWYCLDKSEAEHTLVKQLQQLLSAQIAVQAKADTALSDSTTAFKPKPKGTKK